MTKDSTSAAALLVAATAAREEANKHSATPNGAAAVSSVLSTNPNGSSDPHDETTTTEMAQTPTLPVAAKIETIKPNAVVPPQVAHMAQSQIAQQHQRALLAAMQYPAISPFWGLVAAPTGPSLVPTSATAAFNAGTIAPAATAAVNTAALVPAAIAATFGTPPASSSRQPTTLPTPPQEMATATGTTISRNRGGVAETFPEKLHKMLEACANENQTDIVSFSHHGRAFAIHKRAVFVSEIMPRFFRQSKLTSFQRQLNLYEFKRISHGPDVGAYYHEMFLRGRPALASQMKRIRIKGTVKTKSNPEEEPNFYSMPSIDETNPLLGVPKEKPMSMASRVAEPIAPQGLLLHHMYNQPPLTAVNPSIPIPFPALQTPGQSAANAVRHEEKPATTKGDVKPTGSDAPVVASAETKGPTATVEV